MLWQKNHQGLISSLLITSLLSQTLRLPPSLLADRVQLHLVDAAELLSAAGVEKSGVALVLEPRVSLFQIDLLITLHLDALDPVQFLQAVDADPDGQDDGNSSNGAKAPVCLFDKVLEVGTVETGNEGAHGKT
jgi:hypothetical protein